MTLNAGTVLALGVLGCAVVLGCSSANDASSKATSASSTEAAPANTTSSTATNSPNSTATAPPAAARALEVQVGPKDVTFDDIKLELKKGDPFDASYLTPKVKDLDGKAIRIRGFILPSFQQSGIKQFVLVRDNQECCFGPGALLHDCVLVEMIAPASATYTTRPVSVEGKFSVRELKGPDGKHLAIYHLDGNEVK
jgi:hypothetical protein